MPRSIALQAFIKMGCAFAEIGPLAIGDSNIPLVVPEGTEWGEKFNDPSECYTATREEIEVKLKKMQHDKREELAFNGLIGAEIADHADFEDCVALCAPYVDYFILRASPKLLCI